MFPELPVELQAEIATYLDTPSLCFFARTSWRSLRTVQSHLMRRQQHLLRSPPIKLVASGVGDFSAIPQRLFMPVGTMAVISWG